MPEALAVQKLTGGDSSLCPGLQPDFCSLATLPPGVLFYIHLLSTVREQKGPALIETSGQWSASAFLCLVLAHFLYQSSEGLLSRSQETQQLSEFPLEGINF